MVASQVPCCKSRNGVIFAEGKPIPSGGELGVLRFRSSRPPAPGRHTLTVTRHLDGQRVVAKSSIRLG
ncbi:MAG: hypothetical protein WA701_14715 [Solirubrobacterales bacterium]